MGDEYWYNNTTSTATNNNNNNNDNGSNCVVFKFGDIYFSSIKSRVKYFSQIQQEENQRSMKQYEQKRTPLHNRIQLKHLFENTDNQKRTSDSSTIKTHDESFTYNYKKNTIHSISKTANYNDVGRFNSNTSSSGINDNTSVASGNSLNLRNSKKVKQILKKFSSDLNKSNEKIQSATPVAIKQRHSLLNRKIMLQQEKQQKLISNDYDEENPCKISISDDLVASFQTPSYRYSLKAQINNRNKKLFESQLKSIENDFKNECSKAVDCRNGKSLSTREMSRKSSVTKTSSLSSIDIKSNKNKPNDAKATFSYKYDSPKRKSSGSGSRIQRKDSSNRLTNKNESLINNAKTSVIDHHLLNTPTTTIKNESRVSETKLVQEENQMEHSNMMDESTEDKLITNLFHPILVSLDLSDEFNDEAITAKVKTISKEIKDECLTTTEILDCDVFQKTEEKQSKIEENHTELKLAKSTQSASTQSLMSLLLEKINKYSTDGSVRTHSSLIYQNENNNDITDNDALSNISNISLSNIDDYFPPKDTTNKDKKEESNSKDIYENNDNNIDEIEAIYENISKHDIKLLELKESNSEFLKNTRKNSILLDKILFNDISMFRKSDSKEKYYMARYFFFF